MRRRPDVDERTLFLADTWHRLGTERALGYGGSGPVPLRAITHWADRLGLDSESTMLLIDVIRRLDSDRAEREAAKRDLEAAKHKGGKS